MTRKEKIEEIKNYLYECGLLTSGLSIELRIAIQRALNEATIEYLYEIEGIENEKNIQS